MRYFAKRTIQLAPAVYVLRGTELTVAVITLRHDASGFAVPFIYGAWVEGYGMVQIPADLVECQPYRTPIDREEPVIIERLVGVL